jgi:hypothetical protein
MGNQLFQYASASGLAVRWDRELTLDIYTGFLDDPFQREYELHRFAISARIMERNDALRIARDHSFERRFRGRLETLAMQYCHRSYVPVIARTGVARPLHLRAYLQSHKYFPDAARLRRELVLTTPLQDPAREYAREIRQSSNSTSVHFRLAYGRSADGTAIVGWTPSPLPRRYYECALAQLMASKSKLALFVFSDTPLEDYRWLTEYGDVKRLFCPCKDRTVSEDMFLMSQCTNNVISNSTFSWWAAWLNNCPQKEVYAPLRFFPFDKPVVKDDVFPHDWKVI